MLAKLSKLGQAIGFLIGILEGLVELLQFFKEREEGEEDHLEEIEETVIDIMLIIYDVINNYTDEDLPLSREAVEEFIAAVIKTVEKILDVINVFG